jgi:large subunit ribosomal protein L3e
MLAKKRAFTKYAERWSVDDKSKKSIKRDLERIKKYCTVVRVLVCSQLSKLNFRQRKAHLLEIQVNGGTIA